MSFSMPYFAKYVQKLSDSLQNNELLVLPDLSVFCLPVCLTSNLSICQPPGYLSICHPTCQRVGKPFGLYVYVHISSGFLSVCLLFAFLAICLSAACVY